MRHISDDQRRARIGVRHALAPPFRADSIEAATRAMTVLHATEAPSVYLSAWARTVSLRVEDVDRAFHVDRSLIKQLAMRRTLFVFPRDLLAATWVSASARVAASEGARMRKELVRGEIAADGEAWLAEARAAALEVIAQSLDGVSAADVRRAVPMLDMNIPGSAGGIGTASRVLTHLGATADIVRGLSTGRFPRPQTRWTVTRSWLGDVPLLVEPADGWRELVRRWLVTFGPGTEDDLVWWLGATRSIVRAALREVAAEPVSLDGGGRGWILPDDTADDPDPGPWVALLPVLDPTVMGWRDRDFYLGLHRQALFDTRGNAGTTAWVDGRVVGCWVQDDEGVVEVRLLEDVPPRARLALAEEAARLTVWLDGVQIRSVYRSPAMAEAMAVSSSR